MPTHHIIIISCVVWFISHQTSRPLIKHTPADRMKPIGIIINILIFEFVEISWYEFWSYGRFVTQEGSNTEFQAPLENGGLLSEIILFCLGIFW